VRESSAFDAWFTREVLCTVESRVCLLSFFPPFPPSLYHHRREHHHHPPLSFGDPRDGGEGRAAGHRQRQRRERAGAEAASQSRRASGAAGGLDGRFTRTKKMGHRIDKQQPH